MSERQVYTRRCRQCDKQYALTCEPESVMRKERRHKCPHCDGQNVGPQGMHSISATLIAPAFHDEDFAIDPVVDSSVRSPSPPRPTSATNEGAGSAPHGSERRPEPRSSVPIAGPARPAAATADRTLPPKGPVERPQAPVAAAQPKEERKALSAAELADRVQGKVDEALKAALEKLSAELAERDKKNRVQIATLAENLQARDAAAEVQAARLGEIEGLVRRFADPTPEDDYVKHLELVVKTLPELFDIVDHMLVGFRSGRGLTAVQAGARGPIAETLAVVAERMSEWRDRVGLGRVPERPSSRDSFDVDLHRSAQTRVDPSVAEGEIVLDVRDFGYRFHGRVIRRADVVKGVPPKPTPES